jgi:hypothetical protein
MPADSRGRFEPPDEDSALADVASAARTATGTSAAFDTTNVDSINATLIISAASGSSPTLDLTLETTADGTNYYTAGTFAQQTTTQAGLARVFGDLGDTCRWKWTIGGSSPSFTFRIASTVDRDT